MSDTISPLAKHKAILELLAERPELKRKHDQFRNCLHHISYFIAVLYSLNQATQALRIRCPLKHRCPKCMDASNIHIARKLDYLTILKAARSLGAGEKGQGARIWLLQWESSRQDDGKRLSYALSRSDRRYRALMLGRWGGELVRSFRAIVDSNGPKVRTPIVFNSLIFAAPGAELDEGSLEMRFPGMLIQGHQGLLELRWITYLQRWANLQLDQSSPATIVQWMASKSRMFESLGELRGVRARETAEYTTKLHDTMGDVAQLGFFDRLARAEEVIAHIDYNLPLVASNLLDRALTSNEAKSIMAKVKPQIRTVLNPPMEELARELATLKERVESIERVIGADKPRKPKPENKWKM